MANEFRVKNGLIVDEASSGAGVLTIADSNISSDDGSIEVTVIDGQTVTLGKTGSHANIVVAPHGTAGSEKITVLNTSGTSATEGSAAVQLTAAAGGINLKSGLNGAGAILLTADGGTSETIKIHADQGTGTGSITVVSDAGGIDVDAVKGLTLTNASSAGGDDITIQQTGANDSSIHILAAGTGTDAVNIDATAGSMLIGATLTNAKTLKIGPASATQMIFAPHGTAANEKITLTNTAGTATAEGAAALQFTSTAGGIGLLSGRNAAGAIRITADAGTSETIIIHSDQGTDDASIELTSDAGGIDINGGTVVNIDSGTSLGLTSTTSAQLTAGSTLGVASGGDMTFNDGANDTFFQTDTFTIGPKTGSGNAATATTLTIGNAGASGNNADRAIHLATSEAVYRIALNLDGSTGNMSAPIVEMGVGGTVTANTTTGLPTQAQYTTADTAFAFGADGSVYRIGSDNASSGEVLTFDGTEWLAAAAGGGLDAANGANNRIATFSDSDSLNGEANLTFDGSTFTVTGVAAIAPANDAGVAALLITPIDTNQHGIDINSSIIDANVLDITANATTTGHVINISANGLTGTGGFMKLASTGLTVADTGTSALIDMVVTNDSVGSQTAYGMVIDYNKSGVTGDGKTAIVAGLTVDIDDAATNHASGTATIYGGIFTSNSANAQGTIKNIGVYASAGGGDTNYAGEFAGDMLFTSDTATFTSSNANDPLVVIENTTNDVNGAVLKFVKDKGAAGADGDDIGTISFFGDNAAQEQTAFASIVAEVATAADTDEAGKLSFFVSESNGSAAQLTAGLILVGQSTDDGEVDVTIGAGAGSTTTIVGDLIVSGSTTQVNTTSITVEDALIELGMVDGSAPSSDTSYDLGMLVNYYSSSAAKKAGFYWDSSTTAWSLSEVVTEAGDASQILTAAAGATEMRFLYDAGNYYSIGVAANGATTLQTVDSDGTAGNLQITANGTAELAGTAITLDSAADIELNAAGNDINLKSGSTAFGSLTNSSGVLQIKSAADKELEIRSERDMTFVIDDDTSDSNSFFSFIAEDNTLASSTNFDGRVGPVTTKYYSTSLLIGQTEFGKGVLSADAEGTLFTYDGTVFGAAEVVIHISDGTTNQVNKMLICSDTSSGDAIAYSNYSVLYSDGATELGTVQASISSDTVSVKVDADNNDTVTYAVTFLA